MRYYFSILVGLMAMCCLNDAPAYAGGTDTITLNRGWTLTEASEGGADGSYSPWQSA